MSYAIYLAGPISGCTLEECTTWREEAKRLWRGTTLDPMRRGYHLAPQAYATAIVHDDLQDIEAAHGIVAYIDRVSVGTSMELVYSRIWNKPCAVVNALPDGQQLSPWVMSHCDVIKPNILEALSWLHGRLYGAQSNVVALNRRGLADADKKR